MLRFLKKRLWKEHVKLATQNLLACRYCADFEADSIEAGLRSASPFQSASEINLETCTGYLADLRLGTPLPLMIADDALKMNRELRREYESILQGRRAFAALFGSASERLLPFDQMFTPNEGWTIFLDHFQRSLELGSVAPHTAERDQQLDDLVERGRRAGMSPTKLREAFRNVGPERLRELEDLGKDLARLGKEQNVRVALKQMMDKHSETNSSKMRFFLVDRSIPALEPQPGSMLLLGSDGTWSDISPSEVLADEGSPEVSEEIFVSAVARLGGSMPRAS